MAGEFAFRRSWLWKAALCVALTGIGVSAVGGVAHVLQSRAPFVDLSERSEWPEPLAGARDSRLRFAVATMVSAEATFSTYRRLVQKIGRSVGREATFVLRPSYAEVGRALEQGQVDVAFVCTGTYVHSLAQNRTKLLVQPEFEDGLQYRSLLIVPAGSSARSLEDLRGAVMAFTDPESNTGCLVPRAMLAERGSSPRSFFRKVVFTGSHDHSIQATALGIVDVAAVDELVWASAKRESPSLADDVRVIWTSEVFGPPPIVVPRALDAALESSLREAFLALDQDEEGSAILSAIGIKRFVPPRPEDYRSVVELHSRLEAWESAQWP